MCLLETKGSSCKKEPARANLPLPSPLMFWGRCLSVDFEGIWGRC